MSWGSVALDYAVTVHVARRAGQRWRHPEILNTHDEVVAEMRVYESFLRRHSGGPEVIVRAAAQQRNRLARFVGHEIAAERLNDEFGAHGFGWRGDRQQQRYLRSVDRTLGPLR